MKIQTKNVSRIKKLIYAVGIKPRYGSRFFSPSLDLIYGYRGWAKSLARGLVQGASQSPYIGESWDVQLERAAEMADRPCPTCGANGAESCVRGSVMSPIWLEQVPYPEGHDSRRTANKETK